MCGGARLDAATHTCTCTHACTHARMDGRSAESLVQLCDGTSACLRGRMPCHVLVCIKRGWCVCLKCRTLKASIPGRSPPGARACVCVCALASQASCQGASCPCLCPSLCPCLWRPTQLPQVRSSSSSSQRDAHMSPPCCSKRRSRAHRRLSCMCLQADA